MASSAIYQANILSSLTYELVNGQPVLYRGHQSVRRGQKTLNELYLVSPQQQQFLSALCFNLHADFGQEYFILSNSQLRLQMDERNYRAIDVAVVKKNTKKTLDSEVLHQAPEFIFLVGTRASLFDLPHPFSYYHQKAQDLLNFGVQKVVWLFPEKQQLMVASTSRKRWPLQDWNRPVELEPKVWWDCPMWRVSG